MAQQLMAQARELGYADLLLVAGAEASILAEHLEEEGVRWLRLLEERPVSCPDIAASAREAEAEGRALVVDASHVGLLGSASARRGATLVLDCLPDGHWLVGTPRGACAASRQLAGLRPVELGEDDLGLLLAQRSRRARQANDEAQVVASYLRCHPQVLDVAYPGLKQDPSFALAAQLLVGGFGPVVDYLRRDRPGSWQRVLCAGDDPRATVMGLERALRS